MRNVRHLVTAGVFAILSYTAPAMGDVTIKLYKENRPVFKDYLVGVGRGVFWANAFMEAGGSKKLFCMPPDLALDEGIILSLIDQELREPSSKKPWGPDEIVEFVTVVAFMKRFPCEK